MHATGRRSHEHASSALCFIAPPNVLAQLAEKGNAAQREAALKTLAASAAVRTRRNLIGQLIQRGADLQSLGLGCPPTIENRSVYDVHHGGNADLPGELERKEGGAAVSDASVNQAYDGADKTFCFYRDVFQRNSIDGRGLAIVSSVHYGVDLDNAFWNGSQMVYGDGSGQLFQLESLTTALDVIGHELTHGVTQYTANLAYHDQPGALNESMSDVFGSLVKQHALGQSADQADWLIGAGILAPGLGKALRSMSDPGTAWEYDNQPGNMADYQNLPNDNDPRNDNGGVHINSGIPNHAFYLAATSIGGNAWEKAGKIWYQTLTEKLQPTSDFAAAANLTLETAGELYGSGSAEEQAVQHAWKGVGVLT
jgi:Zn-dependent metalloprotease